MPTFPILTLVTASALTSPAAEPSPATATISADRAAIWPGGTITLAVHFAIKKDWHIYSRSQNDSGFSPGFIWTLPPGLTVGEIRWPVPKRHISDGELLDHVYENEVTLLVPLTADKSVKPGSKLEVKAESKWLVCREACLPGDAILTITVPVVAAEADATPSPTAPKIVAAEKALPKPATAPFAAKIEGSTLVITCPGAEAISFFPDESSVPAVKPIQTCEGKGETLRVPLDLSRPVPKPAAATGIVVCRHPAKPEAKPAPATPNPAQPAESTPRSTAYTINVRLASNPEPGPAPTAPKP